MKKVTLIGDSICGGYQPLVQEKLAGAAEVWRPVTKGGTSAYVLEHLDEWAINRPADIIHLNCGLHDIVMEEGGHYWVPIEAYTENLRRIFQRLRDETEARLIWATTTPVIEEWKVAHERREEDVRRYNAVAVRLAKEQGAEINDLYAVVQGAGLERCLSPDGVHMKDFGNERLADAVLRSLGLGD